MKVYSNELYHYGVVGMKWGVRRYQNPDGSLTARGKKRYGTEEHLNAKREYKSAYKQYSKDLNRAMNNGPIHITKKGRAKNDELWKKADEGLDKAADAYNKYKAARKEAKPVIKEARKLTDEQKAKLVKGLKIGAAVAGTALAAYGVYKVSGAIKDKAYSKSLNSGMDAVDRLLSSSKDEFNRLPDILKAKTITNAPDNLRSGANKLTSYYSDIGSGISLSGNARANAYNNSASLSKAIATLRGKGSTSSAEKIESLLKNKSEMSSDYISDRVGRILKNDPNNKFSNDAINDIKKLVEYARSNARH